MSSNHLDNSFGPTALNDFQKEWNTLYSQESKQPRHYYYDRILECISDLYRISGP